MANQTTILALAGAVSVAALLAFRGASSATAPASGKTPKTGGGLTSTSGTAQPQPYRDYSLPRTVQLHNPGAVRITSDRWQGAIYPGRDVDLVEFQDDTYGARAMLIILQNKVRRGLVTPDQIVRDWSPGAPSIANYISYVEQWSGLSRNTILSERNGAQITALAYGIAGFEAGRTSQTPHYFPASVFSTAWSLMGAP